MDPFVIIYFVIRQVRIVNQTSEVDKARYSSIAPIQPIDEMFRVEDNVIDIGDDDDDEGDGGDYGDDDGDDDSDGGDGDGDGEAASDEMFKIEDNVIDLGFQKYNIN